MISRQDVDDLFQKMRHAGWDMEQKQTWGYFFKDTSETKLSELARKLVGLGYDFVDINQSYPDKLYWLHVEKTEIHTEQSLHQLNQSFYLLAKQHTIQDYDGMDISPADFEFIDEN